MGAPLRPARAPRARSKTSRAGARSAPAALGGLPLDPGRALGARPARGARPRLRRPARARHRPRSRPRRPDVARLIAARSVRSAVRVGLGARRRRQPRVRLQDRGRDRRARRQHRAAAQRRSRDDDLLRLALRGRRGRRPSVLAHTRWASVGIISEAERAPAEPRGARRVAALAPYVTAALNGDVDNYADLKALEALHFPAEITTDAKVIPALVSRRIASGVDSIEAFRSTVASFEGSVAIARAGRAATRASCCSRSGAAARRSTSASPTTASSSRASRTASSRSASATCGSTARRCSTPGEPGVAGPDRRRRRERAGTVDGIERRSYDGARLPVDDVRAADDPRSRRATSTAATRRTTC